MRTAGYVSEEFSRGVRGVVFAEEESAKAAGILCRLNRGYVYCATKKSKWSFLFLLFSKYSRN